MTEKAHETAEQAVVGSMLMRPFEYHSIRQLSVNDITLPVPHRAYEAIEALWVEGTTPDLVSIVDWTERSRGRALEDHHLLELTEHSSNAIELGRAVEIVRSAALDRRVRLVARGLAQSDKRGAKLLSEAMTAFNSLAQTTGDGATLLSHAIRDVLEEAERMETGKSDMLITTGLTPVDRKIHIERGGVLTVAGRPSMGKSALALWLIDQWVKQGERVLLFSTETGVAGVARRFLSLATKLNSRDFGYGHTNTETWRRLTSGAARLHDHPVWIDDTSDNAVDIAKNIRLHRQRDGITVVVIDHIQECIPGEDPRKEINQLLLAVRSACRETPKLGLVLLSQLSRRVESRESKIPQMSDTKESGKIEETSDVVALAFRPAYYAHMSERYKNHDHREMWLSIAKNRDGKTGWLKMGWDPGRGQVIGPLDTRDDEACNGV